MKKLLPLFLFLALLLSSCAAPADGPSPAAQATRAAVQVVAYAPETLPVLQSATLTWTDEADRQLVQAAALTDRDSLAALAEILRGARQSQEGAPEGCFAKDYHHELTLTCQDGSVIRLDVAVDDCCMLCAGGRYYAFNSDDMPVNTPLYALFGAKK